VSPGDVLIDGDDEGELGDDTDGVLDGVTGGK